MGAYQLKNEELTLTVISAGAEMKSLKDNKTEQEYLWQADPEFWGRTSPVLFPIVGNYAQKQSVYEGKTYTLSQHGFARDMEFDLKENCFVRRGTLCRMNNIRIDQDTLPGVIFTNRRFHDDSQISF